MQPTNSWCTQRPITRDAVMSYVNTLVGLNRVYQQEWSRGQRIAEAKYAEDRDSLLAQLEFKLKHPLARSYATGPDSARRRRTDDQRLPIKELAQMRQVCRLAVLFRPKRGRGSDRMKRSCAATPFT